MSLWYKNLTKEIKVKECVIDLGYNDKIMTLLTPEIANINEYLLGD